MDSVIVPLVKNKGGDLTDANNYRAIALSNVETKVLETVLLQKMAKVDISDRYQFGFKKATLPVYAPVLLNVQLNIILTGAVTCLAVLLTSVKHSIG